MLKKPLLFLILIPLVSSGCLSLLDSPEAPPEGGPSGPSPLSWQRTFDNTTYLVRIVAHDPVTIVQDVPDRSPQVYISYMTIFHQSWVRLSSPGDVPFFVVQDFVVNDPEMRPDMGPVNVERPLGPGIYYAVFDSKNVTTTFTVTSDNATLEVILKDPAMSSLRWDFDGDWDYHTRIVTPRSKILHATTHIPLQNNYTMMFLQAGISGASWEVELDPLCDFRVQGRPTPLEEPETSWWWAISDRPVDLTIQTEEMALIRGASLRAYVLDLPLEVPEIGCWHADQWYEPY
jgi:hypothetical protein